MQKNRLGSKELPGAHAMMCQFCYYIQSLLLQQFCNCTLFCVYIFHYFSNKHWMTLKISRILTLMLVKIQSLTLGLSDHMEFSAKEDRKTPC